MHLFIAWRQILFRRRQSAASVVSVALGVGLFIMMTSMQRGFELDFTNRVIAVTPHVQVTAERIRPYPDLAAGRYEVRQVEHVRAFDTTQTILGAAFLQQSIVGLPEVEDVGAVYTGQALVRYGNRDVAVQLRGVEPAEEQRLNGFYEKLKGGNAAAMYTVQNPIILGSGVARSLKAGEGDVVSLVTEDGYRELYKVVDIYQSGITAYDNRIVYTLYKNSQAIFGVSGPNAINIKLRDPYAAEGVDARLREFTGLEGKNWIQENSNIRSELLRRRLIFSFIIGTMFTVAAFGIANIMLMNVMNKRRDIAIMMAFGMSEAALIRVYLTQGLLLGMLGSAAGVVLGVLLNLGLEHVPVSFNAQLTREGFPVAWEGKTFLQAVAMGLFFSVAASIAPARKAAQIPPAEVIRRG